MLKDTGKLHLLIHAPKKGPELCKSLVSSQILGYPTPTLLSMGEGGIAKMQEAREWLNDRPKAEDMDVVMLVDGSHTWFQLPVQVLLQRFKKITSKHLDRTEAQLGKRAVRGAGIHQDIIFSAQKQCHDTRDIALDFETMCWAVPESSERADMYGDETDHDIQETSSSHFRPRWLDTGVITGRVGAVRKVFNDAQKLSKSVNYKSDTLLFGKLFGDQSYYRQVITHAYRTTMQKVLGTGKADVFEQMLRHPELKAPPPLPPGRKIPDYGIGVDYSLEIMHFARGSEWDGRFLRHSTPDDLRFQQIEMGVHVDPFRVDWPLPREVSSAPLPFTFYSKTFDADPDTVLKGWHDLPLYTNVFTGNVPVTMYLNDANNGLQTAFWHEMWYHRYMREMLDGRGKAGRVGAYDVDGKFISWNDLCDEYQAEVFRDVEDDLTQESET